MRRISLLLGTLFLFVLTGLGQKYYTTDIVPILESYGCPACHGGSGGLFVTPYQQIMTTGLHGPVVVPGDSNSYIVRKVKGDPTVGERMPFGGTPLTPGEIATIVQWILEGARESAVAVDPSSDIPTAFALSPNYPNPFNPTTVISFQLPVAVEVRLTVYDLLGREVALLVDERKAPGNYAVRFEPVGLPSGVYYYRLHAGRFTHARSMVLTK